MHVRVHQNCIITSWSAPAYILVLSSTTCPDLFSLLHTRVCAAQTTTSNSGQKGGSWCALAAQNAACSCIASQRYRHVMQSDSHGWEARLGSSTYRSISSGTTAAGQKHCRLGVPAARGLSLACAPPKTQGHAPGTTATGASLPHLTSSQCPTCNPQPPPVACLTKPIHCSVHLNACRCCKPC